MANPTLEESVDAAVAEETKTTPTEETKVEVKEEAKEQAKETPKLADLPKEDDETEAAVRLYRALKDPDIGKSIIQELATRAGILATEQGKTAKQATKATVDILRENVPQEYHFLVEGFSKGIEAIIFQEIEKRVAPIQQTSQQALERMVEKEVDTEINDFYRRNKDAEKFRGDIDKLSTKMPWGGPDTMPMKEYLDNLYTIVSKEETENKAVEKTVNRINKNAKDVRETSTGAQPTEVKLGSKLPTLEEAIKAGFRNERLI